MQVLFAELANLITKVNFMAALKEASRNPTMFSNRLEAVPMKSVLSAVLLLVWFTAGSASMGTLKIFIPQLDGIPSL